MRSVRCSAVATGTWEGDVPGEEYAIRLLLPGPEGRSSFSVVAWADPGGPTRLRVELSPLSPLEELTDDMVLYLVDFVVPWGATPC